VRDFLVLVFVGVIFFLWLMGPTLSEFGHACEVLKERRGKGPNQLES